MTVKGSDVCQLDILDVCNRRERCCYRQQETEERFTVTFLGQLQGGNQRQEVFSLLHSSALKYNVISRQSKALVWNNRQNTIKKKEHRRMK